MPPAAGPFASFAGNSRINDLRVSKSTWMTSRRGIHCMLKAAPHRPMLLIKRARSWRRPRLREVALRPQPPDDSTVERYPGVRGQKRVDAIAAAIARSGGTVVRAASPGEAPFEFEVRLPDGKPLTLICYAFTANKYGQKGRPAGEHRMQVKYGSEFDRLHDIYIDPKGSKTTLFFGVHDEEDLFIAVDPALHNPTWFSTSIEFKDDDVRLALARGWHGWERDRVPRGRRRVLPKESLVSEALLAFTPEHFLTYARFERVATGIDTGERLILIDDIGDDLRRGGGAQSVVATRIDVKLPPTEHKLLAQFGLPIDDLLDLIAANKRLNAAVRGGVAEVHLQALLKRTRGVTSLEKLDLDGQPDFQLHYRRQPIRIECKNVSPEKVRGLPKVDFQKTRAAIGNPCSRYYAPSQFEVLAACIYPITKVWEFRFSLTKTLPSHKKCLGKLAERVLVEDGWPVDLPSLLG